ncbi:MAG: class I adenylate-forming enzyme family protein [Desulfatibacillaceae bacterium]
MKGTSRPGISNVKVIWKALDEAARFSPDATAFAYFGQNHTWRQLDDVSDRLASAFLRAGIAKGDHVGLIALNQPEWLYVYFAAVKIGAVVVGMNAFSSRAEILQGLRAADVKAVVSCKSFGETDFVRMFQKGADILRHVGHYIFIGGPAFAGSQGLESMIGEDVDGDALAKAREKVEPDDTTMIIYTSGTTDSPKGAALTNRSQLASASAQARHMRVREDDVLLFTPPLTHVGGITCGFLCMMLARAGSVLVPLPIADEVMEQFTEHQPTILVAFPGSHYRILASEDFHRIDTSVVRLVVTGGGCMDGDLAADMAAAYPDATLMNLYGLTETSGAAIMTPWNMDAGSLARCIGRPIGDFHVRMADREGRAVEGSGVGEICIKGTGVVPAYFRMKDRTGGMIDEQGWLRTGDMGYLDDTGSIGLKGRKAEMYTQAGECVYTSEVEEFLARHPKVSMVAGIGVPDPVSGTVGRYYVVPRPGNRPTVQELRGFCQSTLGPAKAPEQIVLREELPVSPMGKILKSRLKKEFELYGR